MSEWGARFSTLVPNYDAGACIFKQENLFRVVMLVKRNCLFGRQGLGKYKEIFGFTELVIDLDCERNTSERTGTMYQLIAIVFLQDHWDRGLWRFFLVRNPLLTVLVLLTYRDATDYHCGKYPSNTMFRFTIILLLNRIDRPVYRTQDS